MDKRFTVDVRPEQTVALDMLQLEQQNTRAIIGEAIRQGQVGRAVVPGERGAIEAGHVGPPADLKQGIAAPRYCHGSCIRKCRTRWDREPIRPQISMTPPQPI